VFMRNGIRNDSQQPHYWRVFPMRVSLRTLLLEMQQATPRYAFRSC
jgi:hypothetical protein